jgi:hypothetical protein
MSSRTSEEAQQRRLDAMSASLGAQFDVLWNEIVWLHMKWQEFEKLYAHTKERMQLLNEVASPFFWQLQDMMWRDALLHLARVTDPPQSSGKDKPDVRGLPPLVPDEALRGEQQTLVSLALSALDAVLNRLALAYLRTEDNLRSASGYRRC